MFVLSSDFEGFGISIVEALSRGLPAIVTDCPHGPSEIIQDRQCGYVVRRNSPEHITAVIEEWLKMSVAEKRAFSISAFERSKLFSENEMLKKYVELFSCHDR